MFLSDNALHTAYCYLKTIDCNLGKMSKVSVITMYNNSKYSRVFLVLGVVLLVAGILLAAANFASFGLGRIFSVNRLFSNVVSSGNDINEERVEAISGIRHISVATVSDDIRLIPVDSGEIKAHYYGSYSTTNPDYRPELVVEKSGSRINIKIVYRSNHLPVSFYSDLKLDVYIPEQYKEDIEISSTSGEVSIDRLDIRELNYSNTSGDLNAEWIGAEKASLSTTSGEARLSGEFEDFKFTTISGNLSSDDFTSKKSELKTTSGEINLSGQPGDIKSEAISGNLNLSYSDFSNTIEANSVSGEVEIQLPADAGFELEYGTVSGEAQCDFTVSGKERKKGLKGTVGNGGGSVRINTVSGNMILYK